MLTKLQKLIVIGVIVFILFIVLCMMLFPQYRVYSQELRGKAALREAFFTRQIAKEDAQAEVERAKGVAEANEIIGNSLRNNEEYLRYLWITQLPQGDQVIYVPTEANLPILEAGKRPPIDPLN